MSKLGLLLGISLLVIVFVGVFVARRLQRYTTQRTVAGERGAQALLEMNILTHQLSLQAKEKNEDPLAALPPGERLQRLYPGVRAPTRREQQIGEPEEAS